METTPLFIPKTVKRILFLLHGYGSNGEDMLSLGRSLNLKETAVICPNGVNDMGYGGYNWFPIERFDFMGAEALKMMTEQAVCLVPVIQRLIRDMCQRYRVFENQVILGGFSQGGLVAITMALMTPGIQKVIGMSAVPCQAENINVVNCPTVLLTHGESDPVVPVQAAVFHAEELEKIGASAEVCLSPYLEHGVDEIGIQKIRQFLEKE